MFRWILPVYTALSFAPALVLRRKAVFRDPMGYLTRSAVRTFRSSACAYTASVAIIDSAVLSTFVFIFQVRSGACAPVRATDGPVLDVSALRCV